METHEKQEKMEGHPSQNHVVSDVLQDGDIHEEHAGPAQGEHGSQVGYTGQSSDGGGDDDGGGGDGGT